VAPASHRQRATSIRDLPKNAKSCEPEGSMRFVDKAVGCPAHGNEEDSRPGFCSTTLGQLEG
jgi:hypothetical protein